jgi:hypothetical protein
LLVLGGERHHHPFVDSPLSEAARALVAVGSIDVDLAGRITDDYDQAAAVRDRNSAGHLFMRKHIGRAAVAATAGGGPIERRIRRCHAVVDGPAGPIKIAYVQLASDSVEIAVRIRRTHPLRRGGTSFGSGMHPAVTVTDDQGATASAIFNGSANDSELRGRLVAESPLSLDTEWLELDGSRVALGDAPPGREITIETLTDGPVAHRYLWHRLASDLRHHGDAPIDELIALFVDAGALSVDDPAVAALRFVAQGRGGHGGYAAAGQGTEPPGVPERWRALHRPPRAAAEAGRSLVVGAATPPFDAYEARVLELTVVEDGLAAEVVVTIPGANADGRSLGLEQSTLAWWAADDVGNWYLGQRDGWSGRPGLMQGTLTFRPRLDRRATELRLMPSTWRERAVIAVPLEWQESSVDDA